MTAAFTFTAAVVLAATSAFAWGAGHDTVASETLKRLPGAWGERLRSGEGGKRFLSAAHAPDDQKTLFTDRADYIDGILLSRLTPPNGKTPVMYRFHEADARCELILALSRAMRGGKDEAVGFLLACFNHSVADTVSANHSPLIQLVTYNWRTLGLSGPIDDDCVMLDRSLARKAVLDRVSASLCVKTVVAPCSGLGDRFGLSSQALVSALKQFVARGGRLVWVGGKPKPPRELFPEAVPFAKNTAREPWGFMRGPVAADEMLGGTLVVGEGRFACVREPRGAAGWYWGQLGLDFLPGDPLPEGCRELVRFEARDGRRVVAGYAKGRCAFVPAFSVFPHLFTETRPSIKPLVLELDAAGESVMESALTAVGLAETCGQVTARGE